MKEIFAQHTKELQAALSKTDSWYAQLEVVVRELKTAFANGKKVYVAGNGGSATLAQHLSDEMVGRYKADRMPYPVIALTADSAVITCIGNDFGFEHIFSRQLTALGQAGDIFIAYSTSGNSANILAAAEEARNVGMTVVAFTGQEGKLKHLADFVVISPATSTARIQELDLHAIHLMCEAFEPETT
jgi:D-sedoheptulose 7-phosphate isomerase